MWDRSLNGRPGSTAEVCSRRVLLGFAILKAVEKPEEWKHITRNVCFYSDSQAALKTLCRHRTALTLAQKRADALENLTRNKRVGLLRFLRRYAGNEQPTYWRVCVLRDSIKSRRQELVNRMSKCYLLSELRRH